MDGIELPEDITALDHGELARFFAPLTDDQLTAVFQSLDDEQLETLRDRAVDAFRAKHALTSITDADVAQARQLAKAAAGIRGEQQARVEAAEAVAAEMDALAAQVTGQDPTAQDDTGEGGGPAPEGDAAPEGGGAPQAEPEPQPEPVAAAAVVSPGRRPPVNLAAVRRRQPVMVAPEPAPGPEITASVDVPGYQPGQPLDMDGVTEGIIRRANALKTAGGGVGLVSSYRLPFDPKLIVHDASSGTDGTYAVMLAADQSRLPQGNIVASGGWCAPSETVYTLTNIACPDMLWDAPEVQLARGGLRYFPIPSLDIASMTWVHTEADDISGATKPCFRIPCPEPVEVRCDAVGICLESGILTQRHFPELVAWYQRNVMVAHEIRIRQVLFEQALAQATRVMMPETFGALAALYEAIGLMSADMIERHALCDTISLEVVLPWWSRNLLLADLARQNGRDLSEVRVQEIIDLFATLGVGLQWARGLGPAVPDDIGGQTPITEWPTHLNFLIYVAGSLQVGRGGEISLGVIHDSVKFSTNDYTAAFSEECVTLINRGPDLRLVTVPICPNGATGAQLDRFCAASPGEISPGS